MNMGRIDEFLTAIKVDDAETVARLLDAEPTLADVRDEQGVSPLLRAVYSGARAAREVLLARHPDLDVFEAAAVGDDMRLAALLTDEPDRARSCAPDGFTPAALAAFFGHVGCLRLLLDHGADPDAPAANQMRVTALHAATAHRDPGMAFEMVRLLLDHAASPNPTQHGGWTPLHQAAAHGAAETVRILLEHGADPNACADDGSTPAAMAAREGHDALAAEILSAGASG